MEVQRSDGALTVGSVHTVPRAGGVIGSDPGCAILVPSAEAQHVRLRPGEGQWWLDALTDDVGTFVDGRRVDVGRPHAFQPGQKIQVGGVVLLVVALGEPG